MVFFYRLICCFITWWPEVLASIISASANFLISSSFSDLYVSISWLCCAMTWFFCAISCLFYLETSSNASFFSRSAVRASFYFWSFSLISWNLLSYMVIVVSLYFNIFISWDKVLSYALALFSRKISWVCSSKLVKGIWPVRSMTVMTSSLKVSTWWNSYLSLSSSSWKEEKWKSKALSPTSMQKPWFQSPPPYFVVLIRVYSDMSLMLSTKKSQS